MAENGSFEALQVQNPKAEEEEEDDDEDDEEEEEDEGLEGDEDDEDEEEEEEEERLGELQNSNPTPSVKAEFRDSQSETLAVPSSIPLSETDHPADFASASSSSSQLLAGTVIFYICIYMAACVCVYILF